MKSVQKLWAELSAKIELSEEKVELGVIEDYIKEQQKKAQNLAKNINGYAANARDVSSGIKIAEKYYQEAKNAFEKYINSEKEYNEVLDDVDKFYNIMNPKAFQDLNDFEDINLELKKYGFEVKGFKDNSKELLKAVSDWKSIPSKFKKIK